VCKNRHRNGVTGVDSRPVSLPGPVIDQRRVVTAEMRASDQDRERVVRLLGEHMSAGRLTLTEFEERVEAAYGATRLADLDRLMVDLPAIRPRPTAPTTRASRAQAWLELRNGPWGTWLFVGAICLMIWVVTSVASREVLYFWPLWVIGPWGVAILSHTRGQSHRT
jgi:Domain of unknown function (DUF1707)